MTTALLDFHYNMSLGAAPVGSESDVDLCIPVRDAKRGFGDAEVTLDLPGGVNVRLRRKVAAKDIATPGHDIAQQRVSARGKQPRDVPITLRKRGVAVSLVVATAHKRRAQKQHQDNGRPHLGESRYHGTNKDRG